MSRPDVLVVGAGPTGLALALQAHDHGARVRIVDRRREPFRPSRAMIVYPRTMEVLRPLGVTDALLAADGSTSTVRAAAHISFDGAPYRADVVLADVEITGGDGRRPAHAVAARSGLVFLFPLGEQATWRLLATIPASPSGHSYGQFGPPVPRDELDLLVDRSGLDARITTVAWSSRIRVQHRVASRYRAGPALLAGDAAHTFSPAGGQGMNTGIQDAANLGWKLGLLCARGSSAGPLLTSYETERRPVARMTLALTHLLFWGEAGTGFVPSVLRGAVGPLAAPLVPILLGRRRLTAQGIRLLAQMCWTYRASPLSSSAGRPVTAPFTRPRGHPGDRLRDEAVLVDGGRRHLHELTATAGFKVLLQRGAEQVPVIDGRVQAHRVLSWPGREAVVVRPDGYIGFRGPVPGAIAWLRSLGVDR